MKNVREIGGYLEFEQLSGKEFYHELIGLNSARNAFVYLCRAKKIKKVYLPYFLCESISEVCHREGIDFSFYHINPDFTPRFEETLFENEWLYIVNYYGQLQDNLIFEYKQRFKNIIVDNVQAFFQQPVTGVDTIYSCRKFFGVPDGSYLSTNVLLDKPIPKDISKDRMKHILGRFEGNAGEYYEDFKANDRSFVELELKEMSELTHNILGAIDYKQVYKKRMVNYQLLNSVLEDRNPLSLIVPNGPYCYPFYCKNGMDIKRKLASKKIFVATLWPNVLEMNGSLEKDYAENILPLPCDQRYCEEDMLFVAQEVQKCIN